MVRTINELSSSYSNIDNKESENSNTFRIIAEYSLDGTILDANQEFLDTFHYSLDDIKDKHHSIFTENNYATSVDERNFWQKLANGEQINGEFKRIGKNAEVLWIIASYTPAFDKKGKISKITMSAMNLTQQKLINIDFASKIDAISRSQAVIEFNLDGCIIAANENFLNLMGYGLDEVVGCHHSIFVESDYKNSDEYRIFWQRLNRGEFQSAEFKRITKGGREVWLQASYNPIFDLNNKPYKVVKYATDITEQKEMNANFEAQIAAIDKSQAIIEFHLDGTIINANENFLAVVGYSLDEIKGKHHRMFVDPEYKESNEYKEFWEKLGQGEFQSAEFKRFGKNGKEVWIQASYNPIFDLNGKAYKVVKYATDITKQKLLVKKSDDEMKAAIASLDSQNKHKTSLAELYNCLRGEISVEDIGNNVLSKLAELIKVHVGAFYILEGGYLDLVASYAFVQRKNLSSKYKIGEGIVGQCAREKKTIVISNAPDDYIRVTSGLGESSPKMIMVVPILFERSLLGVIEIGTLEEFTDEHILFLEEAMENIGVSFNSAKARVQLKELLEETKNQQEELKASNEELEEKTSELQNSEQSLKVQAEELRTANEELAEKTEDLQRSEESLRTQAEELRTANEELEDKTKSLEAQRVDIQRKNSEVESAKHAIEQKAKDLELASKYKSEFLANMSHELRTPLNSLLILSEQLSKNVEGNLSEHQIESAKVIHEGGNDLLTLINDILDLSKVEAGKLDIINEEFPLSKIVGNLQRQFKPIANKKNLEFKINITDTMPSSVVSDSVRVEQIVKNLLSNAFKFTSQGSVTLRIENTSHNVVFSQSNLTHNQSFAISVIDTGIGIPDDKQQAIFEAFQQADGSTSRNFGGTGLGLTISRQLAKLLGGELQLQSTAGKGSTFTLYLPLTATDSNNITPSTVDNSFKKKKENEPDIITSEEVTSNQLIDDIVSTDDDRHEVDDLTKSILIIEDDVQFANILADISRKKGFKCLIAHCGKQGLELATQYKIGAIMLDLKLPDMSGDVVLEQLKNDLKTRHIPIHIISSKDRNNNLLQKGAVGYLKKPTSAEDIDEVLDKLENIYKNNVKNLLVVEDSKNSQKAIASIVRNKNIKITPALSAKEAEIALNENTFDCMILDLSLPDISGFELLKKLSKNSELNLPPVIIYTGRDLTKQENDDLQEYAASIVVKGVHSSDRLLDETLLFLHTVESTLPLNQRKIINMLHDPKQVLKNRKILLVDDDLRNTFALSSVLRNHGLDIVMADNGKHALEELNKEPEIELVIMDVMMPVMDGLEAMQHIRKMEKYKKLPIIALTAKAMQEDRAACLKAGANDYLTKPVDVDKLLSLIKLWLFKEKSTTIEEVSA